MPSWGATAALTMRGPISNPQMHLTMMCISPTPIQAMNKCYTTSNWTHLDPKVPHFWDRRCQCKWNYLWSGDCAEMNIPPDWTKTGNPGTQSIFLKQFNKKNGDVSWKIGETQSISCVSPVLVTKKHNCQKRYLSLIQILYKENVKKYFHMLKAIMLHK